MGYKIDAGTIKWARRRVMELRCGTNKFGSAIESIESAINSLNDGAQDMDNQPESDMARSYLHDLQRMLPEMKTRLKEWEEDMREISKGIDKFERKGK